MPDIRGVIHVQHKGRFCKADTNILLNVSPNPYVSLQGAVVLCIERLFSAALSLDNSLESSITLPGRDNA